MIFVADIQREVAALYDVPVTVMREPSGPGKRPKRVTIPRQMAMYLATELTDHSMTRIGQFFGGRDRTTVMFARRQVEKRIEKLGPSRKAVDALTAKFDERRSVAEASAQLRDAILRAVAA